MSAAVRARRRRPALAPAVSEVQRLRGQLAGALADADRWRQLATALADATDHEAERELWAQLAREYGDRRQAEGETIGELRAVAAMKAIQHDLVDAVTLAARRYAPGGAAWLAEVDRNGGTEYGGHGRPRIPVPLALIEAARESAR